MKPCAVLMLGMFGSAICACSGGDDEPAPGRDSGPAADGGTADGPSTDGSGDHTPPTLTETDPADGASGVEPTQAISVRFDEPVTMSEPADAFQLLDESGQPVPGAVEVAGDVLRFVPADDLALLGSYTAVVTPAVTDVAGNPLAGERRFQLSVRDGAWDPTGTLIEHSDGASVLSADVAMDPRGNVVVVWSQPDPEPLSDIWANHYDARTGLWGTARRIELDPGEALYPRVAMDAAGNALATWEQSDGVYTHVWASRYDGTGWDDPVRLDVSDTGDAREPRIAMNAGGAAAVVWWQVEGDTTQAWIDRYTMGAGWSLAEPVLVSGEPVSILDLAPVVAIDAQDTAMVIVHDDTFHLRAVPHLAASGWGEDELLIRGPADGYDIALAPAGYGFVLWEFPQASRIHAWRYHPDRPSRLDVLMETSEIEMGSLRPGDVAVNPAGDGIALWFQDSPRPRRVWAGVYSAAAETWGAPQELFSTGTVRPRSAQVAMDPRGHAHAIWILSDGDDYQALMTTRRVAPGGFGATSSYDGIENASLAVNAQGKAVLIRAVQTATDAGPRIDLDAVFFR